MTSKELFAETSDDDFLGTLLDNNEYTGRCDFENFKKWPTAATQLLINLRLSLDDKFSSGYVMKKTLWKKISQILIENGFEFSPSSCEAKFKGVKLTYKRNIKKLKENPDAEIVWPYFRLLHERYGETENKFGEESDDTTSNQAFEYGSGDGNEHNLNEDETTGIHIKWPYTAVELLISIRLSMEHKFNCGYGSKKILWNKISYELNKNGFLYSGEACATKFKGLLVTYKRNLKNKTDIGREITWPYFAKLHQIFGNNHNNLIKYLSQSKEINDISHNLNLSDVNTNIPFHISDEDNGKVWTAEAIRLLIIKRGEMHEEFFSERCSKKDLWVEVAHFLKNHGIETNGEVCREKFKALVLTFRRNLKKYYTNDNSITWPFFKLMFQKFGNNRSVKNERFDSRDNEDTSNDSLSNNEFENTEFDYSKPKAEWNLESISALLQLRLKMNKDFADHTMPKSYLWKDVSKEMKHNGFSFSNKECESKFKNILEAYKVDKSKNNAYESENTFPFYHLMHQIYPNEIDLNRTDSEIDLKFKNQEVKEKVKSHILTEMFNSSSSDFESYSISDFNGEIEQRKRLFKKHRKLVNKRLKIEEKRNELLERKIEATEKKNQLLAEFIEILKQNKNIF